MQKQTDGDYSGSGAGAQNPERKPIGGNAKRGESNQVQAEEDTTWAGPG